MAFKILYELKNKNGLGFYDKVQCFYGDREDSMGKYRMIKNYTVVF